jgi:hypothetical protein
MKETFETAWGVIASTLMTTWLIGNLIWLAILHSLGNMLGVSWLEVDHVLKVISWSPTMKEIHERDMRRGTGDPEFSKNIQWGKYERR